MRSNEGILSSILVFALLIVGCGGGSPVIVATDSGTRTPRPLPYRPVVNETFNLKGSGDVLAYPAQEGVAEG